jgi:hypothetical protein
MGVNALDALRASLRSDDQDGPTSRSLELLMELSVSLSLRFWSFEYLLIVFVIISALFLETDQSRLGNFAGITLPYYGGTPWVYRHSS